MKISYRGGKMGATPHSAALMAARMRSAWLKQRLFGWSCTEKTPALASRTVALRVVSSGLRQHRVYPQPVQAYAKTGSGLATLLMVFRMRETIW